MSKRHSPIQTIPNLISGLVLAIAGLSLGARADDLAGLIGECEDCHGKDGVSVTPEVPTIAGFSAYYLSESLSIYQEEARPCEAVTYPAGAHKGESSDMCKAVAGLSEADIEALGNYYADKPFVAAKQAFDAALAETGKGLHALNCAKCHEDGGSSADDDAGLLAGQWTPYLKRQFEEFASGERPMTEKMKPKMEALTQDDITALLHYYASLQ